VCLVTRPGELRRRRATVLREEASRAVLDVAELLSSSGTLSLSQHGNISIRLDEDAILITGSSLARSTLLGSTLALVATDTTVVQGEVSPNEMEIVDMHLRVYDVRDDLHCLIHTPSSGSGCNATAR
jgi:L-ribulose-5-phosphate 4-epimerase